MTSRPTVGSLFSGIGGLELGLERAGFMVRWQVEFNNYAGAVLARHWPEVKRYGDIRTVDWDAVERVDLLCGGFPCQDLSFAGRRRGLIHGERSGLWTEFARAIDILRPRYVLVENVPGLLTNAYLGRVLGDLAECGYDAEWQVLSAAAFGAWHLRKRIWIVAYADGDRGRTAEDGASLTRDAGDLQQSGLSGGAAAGQDDVPDANGERGGEVGRDPGHGRGRCLADDAGPVCGDRGAGEAEAVSASAGGRRDTGIHDSGAEDRGWASCRPGARDQFVFPDGGDLPQFPDWNAEPNVGRVANGVSDRVDRLRGLGNAVVPPIPEWIGGLIRRHAGWTD